MVGDSLVGWDSKEMHLNKAVDILKKEPFLVRGSVPIESSISEA